MQSKKRPTGVTIIAILSIIGGLIGLFAGFFLIALPTLLAMTVEDINDLGSNFGGISPEVIPVLGGIFVAISIASFVQAYGLLRAKGWAWKLAIVTSFVGIAWAVVNAISAQEWIGAAVSIAIDGVILYYLYRPHVKAYFGKLAEPNL